MIERWRQLGGPVKIGLILGLLGALLTVLGLLLGNLAPLTARYDARGWVYRPVQAV